MQIITNNDHAHANALNTNPETKPASQDQASLHEEPICDCRKAEQLLEEDDHAFSLEVEDRPDLTKLKKSLLASGGERFQRNDILASELSPKIVSRLTYKGRFFPAEAVEMYRMLPNQCHENALVLAVNRTAEWWTGFALSDDGVWRMHSWGFDVDHVIETTEKKELYYGVPVPIVYYAERVNRKCFELIQRVKQKANLVTASDLAANYGRLFASTLDR